MEREILSLWDINTTTKLDSMSWDFMCFDTETTSLQQDKLEITGISLCDGNHNYYIPVYESSRNIIMEYFKEQFNKTNKLIAHNIVFDLRVLYKYNISFSPKVKFFDTMIAHHLIEENSKHGLKYLTRELLDREVADYDPNLSHYCTEFYKYALDDSYNTWLLYELLLPQLEEQGLKRLFHKIEMPFQRVLLEMAIEGVQIDTELLKKQQVLLQDEILNLTKDLYDTLGSKYTMQISLDPKVKPLLIGNINFNSSKQLIEIFNNYGLEITELTPSGNPSVGKATMNKHKKHPFVKQLQKYKDYNKLYNGFISDEGQININLQSDGKVRPNFMDIGTKTGRMSCSSPNLQQLPNNREGFIVKPRELFTAPKGYKMFSCDYSGQEIYSMAHISKDPDLIKMLNMGQDQHMVNANAVFKLGLSDEQLIKGTKEYKEIEDKYHDYRKKGKIFSFGVPYGMGAHKFSNDFQVSEEEAEGMIKNLSEKFPVLFQVIEDTHKLCDEKFEVRTLAGRIRHFGDNYSDVKLKNKNIDSYKPEIVKLMRQGAAHRQSFNFLIQGLCADMIRSAMVNVWARKHQHPEWGLKTIMQVHDEANYIVKEEYINEATEMVREAFEDVTKNFIVPLKADIVIGDNYGNAKK